MFSSTSDKKITTCELWKPRSAQYIFAQCARNCIDPDDANNDGWSRMKDCVSYTNRKGQTFYLHQRHRADGRTCYVFMKQHADTAMLDVPENHDIVEGIHGQVSLRKRGPRSITDLELAAVRRVLQAHQHLHVCRAADKGKTIEIYEPRNEPLNGSDHPLGWGQGWSTQRLRQYNDSQADYWPQMRFVLVDHKKRLFRVERMCYRSWHDGWLDLNHTDPLSQLADTYMPHLRRQSFFDLWP